MNRRALHGARGFKARSVGRGGVAGRRLRWRRSRASIIRRLRTPVWTHECG